MNQIPLKRFGQHFLRDNNHLRRIIELGQLEAGEPILEVGAGDGTLTRSLLETGARVIAVEIDRNLIPNLHALATDSPELEVREGDIMKMDLSLFPSPIKVIANLPYNIASSLLADLCSRPVQFPFLLVMVQREVGERLAAQPGGKDYGTLTIWVGHWYEVEICRIIPPEAFRPPPKVVSALVRLTSRTASRVEVPDEKTYFRIVRTAFTHRRKTLINNLRTLSLPIDQTGAPAGEGTAAQEGKRGWQAVLEQAAVEPSRRAESLDPEEFARIARALAQ